MNKIKQIIYRIRHIINYPSNIKYLLFNKRVKNNGIVLVIHESNRLGASLLLLHTAEELINRGEQVYIISLQFGELNDEYAKIAPVQIVFSRLKFWYILKKLKRQYGYNRILMVTAAVGKYVKVAYNLNYNIISEIHELPFVIEQLGLQKATKEMIEYSNRIVFPTVSSKKDDLKLVNIQDNSKICVRAQGTYYKKPSLKIIEYEEKRLIDRYPQIRKFKVIIGIGNTSARKGFDLFVKVAKKMPQYLFIWAGKRESYFYRIKDINGFTNNFIYLGQLNENELSSVYSIASLLLLTSRKDTLPSSIFEALLFNVPVIGSKLSGGIVDVINNRNGLLTDKTDVNHYVTAINTIFKDSNYKEIKDYLKRKPENNSFSNYISYILNLF